MSKKPIASCHCGQVKITLPKAPEEVVECNCSLCRRYGVLWTYCEAGELDGLPDAGETDTYAWNGRHVDFHRCSTCGCVTHWAPRATSRQTIGINARLLEPELIAAARLRHKDGAGSGKYLD
nr:GFA family protein [uncultured Devosia sp.]